jgi:hypothetical protein
MAEVLVEFSDAVSDDRGNTYTARACGSEMPDGRWQGWIEFVPVVAGAAAAVRSGRETTQPNHGDAVYWATGLTPVYLEGALRRALNPLVRPAPRDVAPPVFDTPAPPLEPIDQEAPPVDSVLNPFSVFRKGEAILRRQLAALSSWHLVNIVQDYDLSAISRDELNAMSSAELVELIIGAVTQQESIPRA